MLHQWTVKGINIRFPVRPGPFLKLLRLYLFRNYKDSMEMRKRPIPAKFCLVSSELQQVIAQNILNFTCYSFERFLAWRHNSIFCYVINSKGAAFLYFLRHQLFSAVNSKARTTEESFKELENSGYNIVITEIYCYTTTGLCYRLLVSPNQRL